MIGQECIDELADFAGMKPQVASITERAMRGELAFEPALRERVALLEGLPLTAVDEVIATRLTLTPGGSTLVRTMRAYGAYTCLVSGGFTLFTGPVASRIGFDENRGNTLLAEAGRLLGRVAEPILGQAAKLATLRELRERLGLAPNETLAIGDGANDLAMIERGGPRRGLPRQAGRGCRCSRPDRQHRPHVAALRARLPAQQLRRGLKEKCLR